jgi:hypothetical protein
VQEQLLRKLYEQKQGANVTAENADACDNPCALAVQQYLVKHPQKSQEAKDDLLKLIRHLCSSENLYFTRRLPITAKTLFRQYLPPPVAENNEPQDENVRLKLRVSKVVIGQRRVEVPIAHFDIWAAILGLIQQLSGEGSVGGNKVHFR